MTYISLSSTTTNTSHPRNNTQTNNPGCPRSSSCIGYFCKRSSLDSWSRSNTGPVSRGNTEVDGCHKCRSVGNKKRSCSDFGKYHCNNSNLQHNRYWTYTSCLWAPPYTCQNHNNSQTSNDDFPNNCYDTVWRYKLDYRGS